MKNIKKIVLAIDFSDTSKEAIRYAKILKEKLGASLTVLHVFDESFLERSSPYYYVPDTWVDDFVLESKKRGQKVFDELCKEMGENIQKCFLAGTPKSEIVKYAKENNADMIIMGTHGFTGISRIILGSVAEYVVRHASCPVLTIRKC